LSGRPDPQTSEDLVQDVFYKMLKYRRTYKGDSQFTTWMFRIAINSKIDHYRRTRHQVDESEIHEAIPSSDPTPEETFLHNDEKELLRKALQNLSEDKREVLLLSRFQNMKYEDIAGVMGCKVGTIKARIHWAIKELTSEYQKLTRSDEP
jgi:RNA polymerase sigma-70 factor (ECF subfamily)